MNDVLINQSNIAFNKMVMLMKISFLFLAIAIIREGEGRFVRGFGPLRAGSNKKLG